MKLLTGIYDSHWGHCWFAKASGGCFYAVRSLAEGSSLCLMKVPGPEITISTQYDCEPLCELPLPGLHPCHITVLASQLVISDYSSGSMTLVGTAADGAPIKVSEVMKFGGHGPDPQRQPGPHIHSSRISPDGKELVVCDLGCDKIYRFGIGNGKTDTASREDFLLPAGCGPRHCAFHPDGRKLYVVTELSDELLVYDYPSMELLQRLTVNDSRPGGGGHILFSKGKLYISSRGGNDGIAIFRTDGKGLATAETYLHCGSHPRHFCINPAGDRLAVACRDDDKIEIYDIEPSASMPAAISEISVRKPVFVEFENE